ncbi:TadE/TadG family type IV pilus assembly protein, partial [Trueperella bernardiae]|uniref:TadE/TadG family type IV pilus assembly protein n=1 Tax=Trueperella bernardiae TaxID=59561 RepID=UPI00374E24AC
MRSSASSTSEAGNATVGFVASVGLLLMVVYTIIAAGLGWYVHAIATDAAMEGARVGAAANSTEVAEARTRDLITGALSPAYAGGRPPPPRAAGGGGGGGGPGARGGGRGGAPAGGGGPPGRG